MQINYLFSRFVMRCLPWLSKTIFFAEIKQGAVIPTKRPEDAGYDIYACFSEENMVIQPHETVMIPTGIKSAFSRKYVCELKERGSTGSKGMGKRAGIIDSGYRGEWILALTNHNPKPLLITKDSHTQALEDDYIVHPYHKAIFQAQLSPVPKLKEKHVPAHWVDKIPSQRGQGLLGSSGK